MAATHPVPAAAAGVTPLVSRLVDAICDLDFRLAELPPEARDPVRATIVEMHHAAQRLDATFGLGIYAPESAS